MTMTYLTSDLIGTKIMYGSPGYLSEETISKITFDKDGAEIEFESECFTRMTHEEYEYMLKHEELFYNEKNHSHGPRHIFFFD